MTEEKQLGEGKSGKKDHGEHSNPYFLHASDHPGVNLVSKVLDGDNYGTWSRAMKMTLNAKNKLCFVDGTLEKADKKEDQGTWNHCNDMVLSWILNSLSQEIASNVIYYNKASDVWNDLEARFSQGNGPRVFQIRRSIASLTQNQNSISVYYTRLKALWDELSSYNNIPACTCVARKAMTEKEQEEKVIQFLLGLNESYSAVRGQILLMQPLPNINKVYSLLLQEEKQRDVTTDAKLSEIAALLANRFGGIKTNPSANNNKWKNQTNQPSSNNKQGNKKEKPICSHCEGIGHKAENCYWIIGFPSGHRLHKVFPGTGKGNDKQQRVYSNEVEVTAENTTETSTTFTPDQCKQILEMLNTNSTRQGSSVAGPYAGENDWHS